MVKIVSALLLYFLATTPCADSATFYKVDRKAFGLGHRSLITDKKVVVTVNRFCNLGRTFLSETVIPKKTNRFSAEESFTVKLPQNLSIDELESIAQGDDCVVGVSKNLFVQLYEINDPQFNKQAHLPAIKYDTTFDFFFSNKIKKPSIIAVIDNGLDLTHEDLKDNLWTNPKEKNGFPGIDDDNNGYIDDIFGYDFAEKIGDPSHKVADSAPINSHGTHVASLAAAVTNNKIGISGVAAENVKIMALNVFGKSAFGQIANIDMAIRYAADMGAQVINMSLGGRGISSSTERALKYAISRGAFVVAAAGNSGEEMNEDNFFTPASYGAEIDGVVAVGAVDIGDKFGELCKFSNRSTTYVELSAPGCNFISGSSGLFGAMKGNKYGLMAGTSMASPIAAGIALITFSYVRDQLHKKLRPANLEDFLKKGSRSSLLLESHIQQGKIVDLEALRDKIEAK